MPKDYAFACLSQDTESLYQIQYMLNDKDITSAAFTTDQGDYDNLHIRYVSPSFLHTEIWEKVYQTIDAAKYLVEVLPHGSGINENWHINIGRKYITCSNVYWHMDVNGSYDGYIPFTVKLKTMVNRTPNHNFEVLSVTQHIRSFMTYDEDGKPYNDKDSMQDYLDDTFGTSI